MKKLIALFIGLSMLLSGCGKSTISVEEQKAERIRQYNTVKDTSGVPDPAHGKQTAFAYGAVSGVDGTKANGVATMHTFEDGVSVVTANVNILPVLSGKHFVVWLSDSAESAFTPAGELASIVGDARHSVTFETKADPASLKKVIVTLETTAAPESPGTRLAEGILKSVKS